MDGWMDGWMDGFIYVINLKDVCSYLTGMTLLSSYQEKFVFRSSCQNGIIH